MISNNKIRSSNVAIPILSIAVAIVMGADRIFIAGMDGYKDVDSLLTKVLSDYKKGDLIYFHENNIVNHVGMFIDNKQYIHSCGNVKINSISKKQDTYDDRLFNNTLGVYRIKNV